MPISVCIISNKIDAVLSATIQSYVNVVPEVCVGLNNIEDEASIDQLRSQFPNISIHTIPWNGYGKTKNSLQALATYDWILSVDADEQADEVLQRSLANWQSENNTTVYSVTIRHFFGNYLVKYGAWGRGKRQFIRLYNKKFVHWDAAAVHESLILPDGSHCIPLKGVIMHKTVQDEAQLLHKAQLYAQLGAKKKRNQGKRANLVQLFVAPIFTFVKEYVFYAGFLDGSIGWKIAKSNAFYTYLKYKLLLKEQS